MDEDDALDNLVNEFRAAHGDDCEDEYEGEFMDLQRNMGPFVNTVTDAMASTAMNNCSQSVTVCPPQSCIVCSHAIPIGSLHSEHELANGPPQHWESCLTRPEAIQGGLTQQYKVDLQTANELPSLIRARWESLLLSGHTSSVGKYESTNMVKSIRCCVLCTTALEQGNLPQFAIANNLQRCNTGNPCTGGLQPSPLEPNASALNALPMCFEKIESAFDDVSSCPFEGVDATVPAGESTKLSLKPSVNAVSHQWKLNAKQHCAFVVLCATLLRKHAQRESDTIENTTM
jgi:hypothetical protein